MVRHSLKNMIEKYPYFLDKRPISNFFKITKVYNKNFELMYNDLFKTYESFHLNKRMYIWKEQSLPYEYKIHFKTTFPALKSVKLYKNKLLIYKEEYLEEEEKNLFEFTYKAKYIKNNALKLYAYQCEECNAIYFDDLPNKCTECNNGIYQLVKAYECQECGEIYFSTEELSDCVKNNHSNSLIEVNVYKCKNCGQIYFGTEPPLECSYCYEDEAKTIHTKMLQESNSSAIQSNDNYRIEDNSVDYTIKGDYNLKVLVTDDNNVKPIPLSNVHINLTCDGNTYEGTTNDKGVALIPNLIEGEYSIDVSVRGYEDKTQTVVIAKNEEINVVLSRYEDEINDTPFDVVLPPIPDDKFLMVIETYDEYVLVKGFPENDYTLLEYAGELKEGTITPNAYDHDYSLDLIGALNNIPRKEYKIVKEYDDYPYTEPPFNNKKTEDDYHYMKRMIEYNLRLWASLHLTELNSMNNNYERLYANYKDYFDKIGITREDYDIFINNSRLFKENYNPTTLELWKIYGIDSTLVNREKYLLKVFDEQKHPFDESTGLVKCWTPEKWEHKDKFCDGSEELAEYFFVTSSTVRPIRGQNVDFNFKVLNSLAEPIEEEYYVDIYKVEINNDGSVSRKWIVDDYIYDNKFRLSYRSINVDKPTILVFQASLTNGEPLGSAKVVLNTRTQADWYVRVDANINEDGSVDENYVGDGSKDAPFLTLQEALDKVNNSLNLICLQSNIEIEDPLIITQDTIIVGEDNFTDLNDFSTRYVPRIIQKGINKINSKTTKYRKDFFKIVGNKNCKLILSNLRLISGQINRFIGMNTWLNTNSSLDNFESVIIHGGTVYLSITTNQDTYYPFDFVDCSISLKNNDGTVLANNDVAVYYKNKLVATLKTDEQGKCEYKYNINEDKVGSYILHIMNKSDTFFETDVGKTIKSIKNPHYYHPYDNQDVELEITNYEVEDTFKLYLDNQGLIDEVSLSEENEALTISDENEITYKIKNIPFGRYVYYSTIDDAMNSSVEEEWIIESRYPIKDLPKDEDNKTRFIKNLVFNKVTGDINYDIVELSSNPKMEELDGIVIDIKSINDGADLQVDTFEVEYNDLDNTYFLYSDAKVLINALINIDMDIDTGILKGERLGKFW